MRCELDDDGSGWYSIESCGPNRLTSASVEGTAEEMLAIAEAIEIGGSVSFRRCAALETKDGYELYSPLNSMGTNGLVSTEEALELAADIREKLKDWKPEPEQEEPRMTATDTAFAYHATVNLKVHLSHQVCQMEGGESYKSIDSKIVAQAVATAVEALTGPAAGELPHLRLYLHGCMVTADIDELHWIEEVPEPVRAKRCQSPNCQNDILRGTDQSTPYCSMACADGDHQ